VTLTLLILPGPASAKESCRAIAALPATITEPGRHCLTADLRSRFDRGAAITVTADWVTLDLQGHRLIGEKHGPTAIEAVDRRGITIRDGTIAGFGDGIRLAGRRSGYHLVEDLDIQGILGVAVWLEGQQNIVRHNHLTGITPRSAAKAGGIVVHGPLPRILSNDITVAGGTGVEVSRADGAIVEANILTGKSGPVEATGVRVVSGSNVLVLHNELRDLAFGVVVVDAGGLFMRNATTAVDRPCVGGTNGNQGR
jgi:hypothetical protein